MKHLRNFIVLDNEEYYISTKRTFDAKFETMVFKSENNYVVSWDDLYFKHYKNKEKAIKGHEYVVNNLGKCLKKRKTQLWIEATRMNFKALWEDGMRAKTISLLLILTIVSTILTGLLIIIKAS